MQDPMTGELHITGEPPLDTPDAVQKARDLKWLEYRPDQVVTIFRGDGDTGADFIVRWIGKDAILLQPVRTVPSVIDALNEKAVELKRLRGERIG